MPELIDRGFLYIAQPPLYRVQKGKSEVYLKDDAAMEEFLMREALGNCTLTIEEGEEVGRDELSEITEQSRQAKSLLEPLTRKVGNVEVVEQTAIAGALNPDVLDDPEQAQQAADYVAKRLDSLADPLERGWTGTPQEGGGLMFFRTLRGVAQAFMIDAALVRSSEGRRLNAMTSSLQRYFARYPTLRAKEDQHRISGPTALVDKVMALGKKGIGMQRYKGLGEMNPEQLWETTMDENARTLHQVKVGHAEEAGELFTTLMGDLVEPRRNFIQTNALKVERLDV